MNDSRTIYDVFVSYSQRDAAVALEMASTFQAFRLNAFTQAELVPGESPEDAIWEALAESQAFVLVVPDSERNADVVFELGAAWAWNKPVYAIATRPVVGPLAVPLKRIPIYPLSRIEEVAQKIRQSFKPMSVAETSILVDEYRRIGIPADQLFLEPELLSRLTLAFRKRSGRDVASEELVRMLLRLRKAGGLRASKKRPAPKIA